METKKLVLRISGFAIVVMSIIFLLGFIVFYLFVRDIFINGFRLIDLAGFAIGAYFITIAGRYCYYNKIEITDSELTADIQELGRAVFQFGEKSPVLPTNPREMRRTFLPKYFRVHVELGNIKHIMIGRLKTFDKIAKELNSEALNETLEYWHQWFISAKNIIPFPLWIAVQHTPVMFVQSKSGNSFVITTKPFSKNGFKKLVREFQTLHIPFTVEPSLGLL
jgi:hypothetical protein